ncbi:MAG: hypothetical protein J6Z27_04490 [Bacteroidales bacterium]|nr:hypothetical protein [Bacteroidales bacterium]
MAFDILLNLPEGWQSETDTYIDESGAEVTHLEAHLHNKIKKKDEGMVDIYVGETPDDTNAEDQAYSNYADIVGFDEDDPEDFNPIDKIKFNNRNAWTFEALCEDNSPMEFISYEPKKGILAIICLAAASEAKLRELHSLIERSLRIGDKQ